MLPFCQTLITYPWQAETNSKEINRGIIIIIIIIIGLFGSKRGKSVCHAK